MRIAVALFFAALGCAQQYRAFWADAFHNGYKTPAEVEQMVEDVALAKGNAIIVEVRHRGGSYYLRSLEPPVEDATWIPGFDALQYLIERAHARGIEVHAWFPVTPLWPFPRPPVDPRHVWHAHGPHAGGDQMWMSVSSTGRLSTSVDPGHPDVLRYLAEVILEPVRHYEIDGIHLDYIRYPEDADYGWNPKAVERFQRLYNRPGTPQAGDPRWSDFRRRQVTDLVRQIYLRACAIKPSIKVSAALVSWGNGPATDAAFLSSDAYRRVFQDWRGWIEEGIIDLAMPMNYFREATNAAFLDRWLEFQKDRQFRRALAPGLGVYLNGIQQSLEQVKRVLAPSRNGNLPAGITFYSYATTNTERLEGGVTEPNELFYRSVGELFESPASPPELLWKSKPSLGHIHGEIHVEGGAAWLKDGVSVRIESDTNAGAPARLAVTDGTGFFGAVDLPPDRYRVRVLRGGGELYRTVARDLRAGAIDKFEVFLRAEDFDGVTPRIASPVRKAAAPGDLLVLTGNSFTAAEEYAAGVPLPLELAGTQVVVNGQAAPLYSVRPGRIELQLPYRGTDEWTIMVRHDGLESVPLRLPFVAAQPEVTGVRIVEGRYLEIYATGLGAVSPEIAAGLGASGEPLPRVTLPITVVVGTTAGVHSVNPVYAGLVPWLPGRYQVNIELPPEVASGQLYVVVGGYPSNAVVF